MQKGKNDQVLSGQTLADDRFLRKIVHQFAPTLLPLCYLHAADLMACAKPIAAVLHAALVEYPELMKAQMSDERSHTSRLQLAKILCAYQHQHPIDLANMFPTGKLPFVFQMDLRERWSLAFFFDRERQSLEAFSLVNDCSVSEAQMLYWIVLNKARTFFQNDVKYSSCREWPQILAQESSAAEHLETCDLCRQSLQHHRQLLITMGQQIPRPSATQELMTAIVALLWPTIHLPQKSWQEKCRQKMFDWGIFSEPTN